MIRSYYLLTKPGIIFGNALTVIGGFALASKGRINPGLFLATLVGLSLLIASACVFNNYIDRAADQKMARTKHRALVRGIISVRSAIMFALLLGVVGTLILAIYTNPLTTGVALFGFLFYVVFYSVSKYHSTWGTAVGSMAGAVPPVVGYCAVSEGLDAGAIILYTILVLWQMPHFFAIAIYRLEDYVAASIPVLPAKRGIHATKVQMLLYITAFTIAALMLTLWGYASYAYLVVAALLGLAWLGLGIKGFYVSNQNRWARQMFALSLVIATALSLMMTVDHLL